MKTLRATAYLTMGALSLFIGICLAIAMLYFSMSEGIHFTAMSIVQLLAIPSFFTVGLYWIRRGVL